MMLNSKQGEGLSIVSDRNHQILQDDDLALLIALKACAKQKDFCKGSRIHADIRKRGLLGSNIYVGSVVVNMYAKCGALVTAQEVFDELPVRSVVSWNALIAGYTQHGRAHEALKCFEQMQQEGLSPDAITFTCALKACGSIEAVEKGEEIHAEVVRRGLLQKDHILGNALVDMYAKCGELVRAQEVFDELPIRNVIAWSALIAGYAQHGHGHDALYCFERMQHQGLSPDAVTFTCIFNACGSVGAAEKGEEIHAKVVSRGLLDKDTILGTSLVDMYAKCGSLVKAQEVFDGLCVRNISSWNALISGYAQHGHGHEALISYEHMQRQGLFPDAVTFTCILKACGSIGAAEKGKQIHCEIIRRRLLENDNILGTALVDMYAKCGALGKAQDVFDELSVRNAVSWNALIGGYAQFRDGHEALKCYERMQQQGFSPDAVTFISALKACGSVGTAEKGEEIHAEVVRQGLLENDIILGNALVDMYAKCGALANAQEAFDELPVRDVVSWSALIAGYAQLGKVETVCNLLNEMIGEGIEPNAVTFIVLLNACSHSGLVDEGQLYFVMMSASYGIIPILEHLTCMVDLFGRAGHLDKAVGVIEKMAPSDSFDCLPLWSALLGACWKWGNVKTGRLAFDNVVQLNENAAPAYACMSNIYAAASMPEDADKVESMRVRNNA